MKNETKINLLIGVMAIKAVVLLVVLIVQLTH